MISMEPAEMFDRLSILEIKKWNSSGNPELKQNLQKKIETLQSEINSTIGYEKAKNIYGSHSYASLYNANLEVFEDIEQCHEQKKLFEEGKIRREDCMLGFELDQTNYRRIIAKQELNKKWFKQELSEIKIGY